MKKLLTILIPIIIILVVAISIFYSNRNTKSEISKIDNLKDINKENKTWLSEIVGQVTIERNLKKVTANSGDEVYVKDIIETQNKSSAIIVFADGSKTDIAQNTKFEVKNLEYQPEKDNVIYLVLNLVTGSVYNTVSEDKPHRFDIETAHAVATVRGTEFAVEVKNDTAQIKAFKHDVKIKSKDDINAKEIDIKEGKKMTIIKDKVEKESNLDSSDMQMMDKDFRAKYMLIKEPMQDVKVNTVVIGSPAKENKDIITLDKKDEIKVPLRLEISLDPKADLRDGKSNTIKSYIVYQDKTKKDILNGVRWQVTNNIGSVKDGIFRANLPQEYSEVGEIFGSIRATIIIDGVKFDSNTLEVKIEPFYEQNNLPG